MIEISVDCLNPGCKIKYKIDEIDINIEETIQTMTDEVIRVMNNRELLKLFNTETETDLFAPPTKGLNVTISDSEKDE